MRAILLCRRSYMQVCMALPLSRRCSTMAAASFFTCPGSLDSSRALLGVATSVRAAVHHRRPHINDNVYLSTTTRACL